MMKFVFAFTTLAVALASASGNRYNVKLYVSAEAGGQVLKAGDYRIEMKDNHAVIKGENRTVEAEARIENGGAKFSSTAVRYSGEGPGARIEEIRIGGTTTRIVFAKPQAGGN